MEMKSKFEWRKSLVGPAGAVLVILIILNLISRNWFERLDFTKEKMYTLSESSKSVIAKIDDLMTMKVYFSGNLPGQYGNNRRFLQDILEEYAAFSKGNIRFQFFKPGEKEELEQEAQQAGIQPVQLQVIENDKMEVKRVFMGLAIIYQDEKEVIPVIQTTTGLEYDITTKIKRLVETNKPVLAIAKAEGQETENRNISSLLQQRYTVRNIDLQYTIENNIELILVNGLEDSLQENERKNLEIFLNQGGNILLAQSRIKSSLQTQQASEISSDIFDIVDSYGLSLQTNLVLDKTCGRVNVQQNMGPFRMAVPMSYPLLPVVRDFNKEEVLVSGLEQVQLFFASEIRTDSIPQDGSVNVSPLMFSSNNSSLMSGYFNLHPDPKTNPAMLNLNQPKKLLSARSERSSSESGLLSQMILVSDSRFLADDGGGASPENHIFVMNAVDFLLGDRELIALRSREITNRPLAEIEDSAKVWWKWFNIVLPTVLVVGFGFFRMRRSKARSRMLEDIYG